MVPYRLFSARCWQLTHCARLNIQKFYLQKLSSIITIMLVCPRCVTSNLHNPCSLSIHLAWYYTGPTFLSNALTTGMSTSHSHDGRNPLSMATTSHQQARHFNAQEVNIALPTINTLHTMLSMSHLSSTQTNLAQSNVHYTDFDDADYSHDNDNHNFIPVHGVNDIIIEKCSFLRNASEFHLMLRFRFIVWARYHSTEQMISTCSIKSYNAYLIMRFIIASTSGCYMSCPAINFFNTYAITTG